MYNVNSDKITGDLRDFVNPFPVVNSYLGNMARKKMGKGGTFELVGHELGHIARGSEPGAGVA